MFCLKRTALVGMSLFAAVGVLAADLTVPQQYPTIQSAIDAAPDGATILISAGSYRENLVINRPVSLRSLEGAGNTVIDGGRMAPVVLARGSGSQKVSIAGFTITNGFHGITGYAGGIHLESVVAEIVDNVIRENVGCVGAGVSTITAAVTIQHNRIESNTKPAECEGAPAGGVFLTGDGVAPSLVANNIITGNVAAGGGAGMYAQFVNKLTIRENLVTGNQAAPGAFGGGLFVNVSSAVISGNVLTGNFAEVGGAMALVPADSGNTITLTGNVMGNNLGAFGSAVYFVAPAEHNFAMTRNVIDGHTEAPLVQCGAAFPYTVPANNRLRNTGGPEVSDCSWRSVHVRP